LSETTIVSYNFLILENSSNYYNKLESTEGDTNFTPLLLEITNQAFASSNATILIVAILVLLLMTAITAGAETAYFSLAAKDINFLKTNEKGSARIASQLLEQPKRLLATILVANNFINIAQQGLYIIRIYPLIHISNFLSDHSTISEQQDEFEFMIGTEVHIIGG
jgi:CBS domain containing-hemolysin-like protein